KTLAPVIRPILSQNHSSQTRVPLSNVVAQFFHHQLAEIGPAHRRESVHHLITRNDRVPAAIMKTTRWINEKDGAFWISEFVHIFRIDHGIEFVVLQS